MKIIYVIAPDKAIINKSASDKTINGMLSKTKPEDMELMKIEEVIEKCL